MTVERAAGIVGYLPDVNALLNTVALVLITSGLVAVKRGELERHKKLMLAAVGVSAAFLVSYLVYHYVVGSVKFEKQGPIRTVYFAILISHIILAAVQVPLIIATVVLGLRDRLDKHRMLAKITAPVWIYVSVTGVVVYVMLYWL